MQARVGLPLNLKTLGYYFDNSNVKFDPSIATASAMGIAPEENRIINSRMILVKDQELTQPFCDNEHSYCPRRFDQRLTWISSDRLSYLTNPNNSNSPIWQSDKAKWGYCATLGVKEQSDEEFVYYQ